MAGNGAGRIDARIAELGIELPRAHPAKVAKIRGWHRTGNLLFVSGQVPKWRDEVKFVGKVGREFGLETGRDAARLSALNMLAQAKEALDGDLDRIRAIVKLTGFVNATPDFTEIPQVVNGASELFLDIFGEERGAHARTAVGVAVMPFDVAIEVEGIFEVV
jgi:enamine deaminase RidA (YjgF/YER057c/UK114 family)